MMDQRLQYDHTIDRNIEERERLRESVGALAARAVRDRDGNRQKDIPIAHFSCLFVVHSFSQMSFFQIGDRSLFSCLFHDI